MKTRHLPILFVLLGALACGGTLSHATGAPTAPAAGPLSRTAALPAGHGKVTPPQDAWPPVTADGWSQAEPLPGPINTAGAEDSPFIASDGSSFFFFFTPDVRVPPEKQLLDGVTGIWVSRATGAGWDEPQRVVLADPGKLSLDGCPFFRGDTLYFCSAREGNARDIDIHTAKWRNTEWSDWQNWGTQINVEYQVGEMHISADGRWLVFGSQRPGGMGGYDLWLSEWTGTGWGAPLNPGAPINTAGDENRPCLSADGQTLWYDGTSRRGLPGPAIFRSVRQADGNWGEPQEIVSQFAGEPSLSGDGSMLYFVHPFFSADLSRMIEADIYWVRIQP